MSKLLKVLFLCVAGAAIVFAQVNGRLTGSVVDPSGASVVNATVNVYLPGGKTPLLTMKTTSDGNFDFTSVRPETYRLEVVAPGFTDYVQNNVVVDTARQTSLPVIHIAIQAAAQAVEVSASAANVETNSVEVTNTVTQSQVTDLPVLDRQINNLFYTQPGVVSNGRADSAVNGMRAQNINVTLDGVNVQDNFIRINGLDYLPNKLTIGEVAEVTLATSNANPTVGGNAMSISMVSNSGTNTYHGNAYWYQRNNYFSANDWFDNKDGVARPFLNLNQFGGAFGGPIKKDKLFFFTAYETYDLHQTTPESQTILTPSARQGILTYRTNGNGAIQTFNVLQNPGAPGTLTIDKVVAGLLSQMPTVGNNPSIGDGLNTTGYQFNARSNERRDAIVGRVDWNLSPKNAFSGTWRWNRDNVDRPDIFAGFNPVSPVSNNIGVYFWSASWRWNPKATLVNELGAGGNIATAPFAVAGSLPSMLITTPASFVTNPSNTFLPQGRNTQTYNAHDAANWIHGKHSVSFGFQTQQIRVTPYNFGGIVPNYTLGVFSANQPYGYGTGDIPGANSTDTNTANNLLGLLSGAVQSATQSYNVTSQTSGFVPGAPSKQHLSSDLYALYVSDTWKITPKLTAILGLRWDYTPSVKEQDGLLIQPQLINNNPVTTLLSNATLTFQGQNLYNTSKKNFAPNVGLAWSPFRDGKTVFRAGYSIAYANDDLLEAVLTTATANSGLTGTSSITNASGFISAPPSLTTPKFQIPITTAQNNINTGNNNVEGLISPYLRTPYSQQWNFTIEQQWKGIVFDAGYIGNHGVGELRQIDFNQININQGGYLQDFKNAYNNGILSLNAGKGFNPAFNSAIPGSVALPFFNTLPGGGVLTNSTVRTDILTQQAGSLAQLYQQNAILPGGGFSFFPNPNALYSSLESNFTQSSYNGLQLEARRATRSGIQFQVSYVFSKAFSDTSVERGLDALLDNANPGIERARAPWDQTQAIKANHVYPIPAGEGHRFNVHGLNWLLGNWDLNGLVFIQSGAPISILDGSRGTLNRGARSGQNTVSTTDTLDQLKAVTGLFITGNGPYFVSPSVIGPNGTGAAADGSAPFSGQVFFNPTAGSVGSLQRRILSGPWYKNYDAALDKRFKLTEHQSLKFRADFYNIFNHPNFYEGDQNINSVNFGKITSQFYGYDGVGPRLMQFSLFYQF
ncbi:MAG TPA: TonB-dependent receptor [Bryobacteraceae bacterium]|nr:TonB-dependent receptor [Bryobacteraceae bacterium]